MRALKRLFLDELADRYDSERQLVNAMPMMAEASTCPHLKKLILAQNKEDEGHIAKLKKIFLLSDEEVRQKKCETTLGLLLECEQMAVDFKGSSALNAALVCIAQKIKHYAIASYGCLHEWAAILGNHEAAGLLDELLAAEKTANQSLIKMARFRCNKEALEEFSSADFYCDRFGHEIAKSIV